jgi:hypothetical protein
MQDKMCSGKASIILYSAHTENFLVPYAACMSPQVFTLVANHETIPSHDHCYGYCREKGMNVTFIELMHCVRRYINTVIV